MPLSHEQLHASHSFSTRVFDSPIKVLQVLVVVFLLLLMLLFVKGIEVRITILVFIHLKFVVTLSKMDTFGTGTKCPSKSDVCLNESHIRREKK